MTHAPVKRLSRDTSTTDTAASVTENTRPAGVPRSPLRDSLFPLESLLEAARIGLGLPDVHLALRPDLLNERLGDSEGAPSGAPQRAEQSPTRPEQSAQLFGLHLGISPLVATAVIEANGPVAVEDTRTHALFRDTLVVDSRRLLAVAAAPLRDANGQVVAALFAGEGRPRWWNERDLSLLMQLARVAEPLLAMLRAGEPTRVAPVSAPAEAVEGSGVGGESAPDGTATGESMGETAGETAGERDNTRPGERDNTRPGEREDAPVGETMRVQMPAPVPEPAPGTIATSLGHSLHDSGTHADAHTRDIAAGVLNALAEGVLLLDEDWRVRWHNARAGDHFAIPLHTLEARDIRDAMRTVVDSTVLSAWERAVVSDRPVPCSWHQPRADRWFAGYAVRIAEGLLIVVRDVTLQRRAEEAHEARAAQVREGETLEAIALLAGGVAHDFNNLLTVIAANAELLQPLLADTNGQTELRAIRQAAVRATQFTEQLLASGRQLALEPDVIVLNDLLGMLEPQLRMHLPDGVRVDSSLTSLDTRVQADPFRIAQVVRQLVRNAGDAMAAGGVLRVCTEVRVLDRPLRARPKTVPAGAWVVLEVSDNGHGVAPAQLDRIFEPFFTTRAVGDGLGLGLATSYGIVAQSGGACTVESRMGLGTTLRVWLPAITPVRGGMFAGG